MLTKAETVRVGLQRGSHGEGRVCGGREGKLTPDCWLGRPPSPTIGPATLCRQEEGGGKQARKGLWTLLPSPLLSPQGLPKQRYLGLGPCWLHPVGLSPGLDPVSPLSPVGYFHGVSRNGSRLHTPSQVPLTASRLPPGTAGVLTTTQLCPSTSWAICKVRGRDSLLSCSLELPAFL